jgi:AcrR family transcriptional regulator
VRVETPFEDPLESLPETARRILSAAHRLLAKEGYDSLTLEHVAAEAGVNKASIRYNFGNKTGLVTAVVDGLIHDECLRLADDLRKLDASPADRVRAATEGIGHMIVSADHFRGFFDILPHAFRDPDLRARLFALYEWWYRQNLEWLGLGDADPDDELLRGLAELIAAIPDGLSLQAGLDPDNFDLARPLRALELLLRNSMADLQAARRASLERHPRPEGDGAAPAEVHGAVSRGSRSSAVAKQREVR